MPSRRALLAASAITLSAGKAGCAGLTGGQEENFEPYSVAVQDARGDGGLSIQSKTVHDATADAPAVLQITMENKADERRRYYPTHASSMPFNNRSFEHQTKEDSFRTLSIEAAGPGADPGFERYGACWHHDLVPDDTGALEYDAGERAEYHLGVAGRSLDIAADKQKEDRCVSDGTYVGTEALREYDAWLGPGFDEDENQIGEVELELEVEIERGYTAREPDSRILDEFPP